MMMSVISSEASSSAKFLPQPEQVQYSTEPGSVQVASTAATCVSAWTCPCASPPGSPPSPVGPFSPQAASVRPAASAATASNVTANFFFILPSMILEKIIKSL